MIMTIKNNNLEKLDEKILLIAIIGSLETIKSGAITIDEAEKFLFSPHMIKVLRDKGCDDKIVNVLEKGCELEDIYDLFPAELETVIDKMKQEAIILTRDYEEYNKTFWLEE